MARALSNDLRSRVLAVSSGGLSARAAAQRFGIGASTAISWVADVRRGQLTAAKQGRPEGSRLDAYEAFIAGMIEAHKDITRNEMVSCLLQKCAVLVGRSTLDVWLRKWRWTFKKKTAHALEQEQADVVKQRQDWVDGRRDPDPQRLVFIDETGLSTKMSRLRGRSLKGQRCHSGVPHGHCKTTTFTGALRVGGMTAPLVLNGAMDGAAFRACIEQMLVPTLSPGDIVVMDNLRTHKARGRSTSH